MVLQLVLCIIIMIFKKCSEIFFFSGSTKTPPCILRKNRDIAEKHLQDILELTEREKIFSPSAVSNISFFIV